MMYRLLILGLCGLMSFAIVAKPMPTLNGTEIKQLVSNKLVLITHTNEHIYDTTTSSYNGHLALAYFANGVITGAFTQSGPGRDSAARMDTGKWWIKNNQQCYQWKHWQHQKTYCITWHTADDNYVLLYASRVLAGMVAKKDIV